MPKIAWPTLGLAAASAIAYVAAATAAIGRYAPIWITIPVTSVAAYVMFWVAHEASHHLLASTRWVNSVIGRLAWLFVLPMFAFPAFGYAHLEHHRHTNDGDKDPDMFVNHGSAWQLPLRWAAMDALYAAWYFRHVPARLRRSWRRPMAEMAEGAVVFSLSVAGICVAIVTSNFWTLAIAVLIPQRITLIFIGWWLDWLPHHELRQTHRENRYRATRVRVGLEWLLTPVLMSQNYHLVHHLHPGLPFYRLSKIWRRNEAAYLDHDVAIATAFGKELNSDEFREWKRRRGAR